MGDMQPGPLLDTVIRSYGIHPWYIYNVKEQMDGLRKDWGIEYPFEKGNRPC